MITRTHLGYVAASAWQHSRPKAPSLPHGDWVRIGGGVVLAAIVAVFIGRLSPAGAVLVNVGSFFGALLSVLPRHHSRLVSVVAGIVLIDGGVAIGLVLRDQPAPALCILFAGLFVAGMARTVSVGAFLRLLFAAIAVCAAAELAHAAPDAEAAWRALGAFALGQVIVAACACIGHPRRSFGTQRDAAAELYRQLVALAEGQPTRFVRARTLARESVELIPLLELTTSRWIRILIDAADDIAAAEPLALRRDDVAALGWILDVLDAKAEQALPEGLDLSPGVALAVDAARTGRARSRGRALLSRVYPSNTIRFYLRELGDVRGNSFRFALRVAATGVICQAVGQFLIKDFGGLPYHGFWTLLAGCLMVMPDYHGTVGKAIARTAGSIIGAVLGTALSLLPLLQTRPGFLIIVTLFVLGYLAARTISQGVLMIVVVGWLAFLLGGEAAGFTRAFDTVVAAFIAAVVFFALPTWNVDRLRWLFAEWCACGRAALTAAATATGSQTVPLAAPDNPETRARRLAFTDLYHAQRRFALAAEAVPMEPRSSESPWPLAALPAIADVMDRIGLALLQFEWLPHPADAGGLQQIERYAEWFSGLAAGNRASVQSPPEGPLRSLWIELDGLESLVSGRSSMPRHVR